MREANRPMAMTSEADLCGVDATTREAARECLAKEDAIAREMAALLLKHFPGYPWEVKVEMERLAGMVRLPIMPPNHYFILPFRHMLAGPNEMNRCIKKAGGELLERFCLSRTGIRFDEFEAARPRRAPLTKDLKQSAAKLILN
jgi:hypothetical protein